MRLIVKIAMSKNQNQATKMVETQTECDAKSELDNKDDSNTNIDFIKKTPSYLQEWLRQKVGKFIYS